MIKSKKKLVLLFTFIFLNVAYISISFYNDFSFFIFENEFNSNARTLYWIIKGVWLVSLAIIEWIFIRLLKNWKAKSDIYRKMLVINGIVYMLFFIFLFPGYWGSVGDEFLIYWAAKYLWIWPQQGAVSGMIMIWELMFWPAVWMPILIQVIFTLFVFSRISSKLWMEKKCIAIFFEIVMFSPFVICFTFNPIRIWIFTVAFVAFLAEFYFSWKCGQIDSKDLNYMCFLLCIIVCIRTEAKFMLIMGTGMIFLLLKHCIGGENYWKKLCLRSVCVILSIVITSTIFTHFGGNAYRYNSLEAVSFVCPLSVILADENSDLRDMDKELLAIDKVFPINDMEENPSSVNFWRGNFWIDSYADASKKNVREMEIASVHIFLRNMPMFIKSRIQMLSACLPRVYGNECWSIERIKQWGENNHETSRLLWKDFQYKNFLREKGSFIISGKWIEENNIFIILLGHIVYGYYIPFFSLIIMMIRSIIKRQIEMMQICAALCVQFVLLFLLIPNASNMYYVTFYLLGWVSFGALVNNMWMKIYGKCD